MNSFFAQSTDSLNSDNFLTGQDGHDQAAHNQYEIVGYEKAFLRIKKIEHIITCYENSKQKTEEDNQSEHVCDLLHFINSKTFVCLVVPPERFKPLYMYHCNGNCSYAPNDGKNDFIIELFPGKSITKIKNKSVAAMASIAPLLKKSALL